MQQTGCNAPHAMAVLAMTAHRLARPGSTLAGDEPWRADDVYWPDAHACALEHLYRAMDVLLCHRESREQEICFQTADLFNAAGDLICWDTPTLYGEIDDEEEASALWQTRLIPALRKRGHHKAGRDGTPQVVGGLALTRAGLPVRSWVLPGHTADVTTSTHLQDALRGWRFNRWVCVGDRGMVSAANRQRLRRALGRDILAVPMRTGTAGSLDVLTRPGRDRDVAPHLRVKEVSVGEGERRRRDGVCHTPDEAAREPAHRARLLEVVQAALAALDVRQADHPKKACELMASRRFGRSLRMDARGRLRIDTPKVTAEAKYDGTFVVTTNDDTRDAAEVALGYTSMMRIEGGCRRMTTTGLQTRPLYHGRSRRIIAHVKLCGRALLLERAAESRGQQTWRTIRHTLDQWQVVRSRMHGKTIVHSPRVTAPLAALLRNLGIPLPQRMLAVSDEAPTPDLP
jgi:Transposase DDE domain